MTNVDKLQAIDMTQNRVPYGLLTAEEKAALHEHCKAGGGFEFYSSCVWLPSVDHASFYGNLIYRTVPLPAQRSEQSPLLTQDEIAWDRLPEWAEWVARDMGGGVFAHEYSPNRHTICWAARSGKDCRIDDFPGIVIKRGTCDWKDSKQRRPKVRE